MWVSAIAFGAVSFSVIPSRYAAALLITAILFAAAATAVPAMKGKIGPAR